MGILICGDALPWALGGMKHQKRDESWVTVGADTAQITDQRCVSVRNYPSLSYIRLKDVPPALLDAQTTEQSDSVTTLTGAVLCDE